MCPLPEPRLVLTSADSQFKKFFRQLAEEFCMVAAREFGIWCFIVHCWDPYLNKRAGM